MTFLEWYADQYQVGPTNRENYRECASYLEGLRDAMTNDLSQEAINRLIRCEEVLRGAANMVDVLKREKIAHPSNPAGNAK